MQAALYRLIFCLLAAISGHRLAQAQSLIPATDSAVFSFTETVHDFGKVPTDTVLQYRFEFRNEGNAMLIINDISLSCPCFTADWSRGPVMPGGQGWVSVQYPTTEKTGPFEKTLWIASNAVNNTANMDRYELHVKGTVVQKENHRGHSGKGRKKSPVRRRKS